MIYIFLLPAQSQYRLGEKHNELIISPLSSVYKCFPSLRSHNIALPSRPPLAHNEPSGDTVTVFKYEL
jgi:hypothetical protein